MNKHKENRRFKIKKITEINEIGNKHIIWRITKPNVASLKILIETNIVSLIKK